MTLLQKSGASIWVAAALLTACQTPSNTGGSSQVKQAPAGEVVVHATIGGIT